MTRSTSQDPSTPSSKDDSIAKPHEPSALGQLARASGVLVALTLLTGIVYPLVVTGVARAAFPNASKGSPIVVDGKVVGSKEIGQPFDDPKYFWGRPSATSPQPYNAQNSSGSNLGPTNPDLAKNVEARIAALRAADPGNTAPIPVDLVTSSGSGLDPHITPAAAAYQARRVARVRGISEARVNDLVRANTEGRDLGVLGELRVNVLMLNLALDREAALAHR